MWIFLVTDAMSFAGLLIAYAILRATKDWPNPIEALGGVDLPAFMTFLLICSSVTMVLSIDACRMKNREKMKKWLLLTILGGFIFLGLQTYEYTILYMQNMGFELLFVYKRNYIPPLHVYVLLSHCIPWTACLDGHALFMSNVQLGL